jgi:hypothetical protein
MEDPNRRQVGGTHYRASYGHWDLAADVGLGYFEGSITKYIYRWRKKNGVQDVEKAIHYYEKLLRLYEENRVTQRTVRPNWQEYFTRFSKEQQLSSEERTIFIALISYQTYEQLVALRPQLDALLRRAKGGVS